MLETNLEFQNIVQAKQNMSTDHIVSNDVGVHLLAYRIRSKIFCAALRPPTFWFPPALFSVTVLSASLHSHPTLSLHPAGHPILPRVPLTYPASGPWPTLFLPPWLLFS